MSPRFYETEILGNWICKDTWPGYTALEFIRYKKDGTWNSFGQLIVDFPIEENTVKVNYSALGTGVWEINDQSLVSMIDSIKLLIGTIHGLMSILIWKNNLLLTIKDLKRLLSCLMIILIFSLQLASHTNVIRLKYN